jgi:hypothetical protein
MQDCVSWFIDTSAQLVTTPATRYDSGGKIPTNAQDLGAPVHSIDPHRVNGRKNNKHASGGNIWDTNYSGVAQFPRDLIIMVGVDWVKFLFLSHVFFHSGFLSSLTVGINFQLIRECKPTSQ